MAISQFKIRLILQQKTEFTQRVKMDISDKVAVVTGASSGLGAAISKALIGKGAVVYGLARNSEALNNLRLKLGEKFIPKAVDISDRSALQRWISETFSERNTPLILINNAGVGSFGKIDEMESSEWSNMINVNINGLYFITAPLVSLMKKKQEFAHIINIGSILGKVGRAESAAYCTSKFGVQGFSEALSKELRSHTIKVTCLNPGSIDTGFFETSGIEAHRNMLQPAAIANTVIHILETPDNMLIDELTMRPLNPKRPDTT